jgi:hypothetical protein
MEDNNKVKENNIRDCLNYRLVILVIIPVAVSIGLVYQISMQSGYNGHPDEYAHLDAIYYFRNHWWPPDLNADGIVYSGYGWSRLYDGELVYLLYGKLIRVSETFEARLTSNENGLPETDNSGKGCGDLITTYRRYRPLNVWLYLIT